jgi:predicted transcriptional regulator
MPRYSVRVSEDLGERIEQYADEYDGSRSDALREILHRGVEYDSIRQERDSLQNQLNTLAGREREHGELVEYVEREKSLRERERERRDAPAWRRAKWWLFGRGEGEA